MAARFKVPAASWTLFGGVARPKTRGRTRLTGSNPVEPIQIEENVLSHPDDLKAAMAYSRHSHHLLELNLYRQDGT